MAREGPRVPLLSARGPIGHRSFVLVHGAVHGAWCWERLVPHLQGDARVDTVVAVDLPGRGAQTDAKPIDEITLDDYVEEVVRAIESRDLRNVVLVGHSLAGITIAAAAHRVAERIRSVVYVATSNPPVGQSVQDLMNDPQSPVNRGFDAREMFCNDLDETDTAWLLDRLCDEPPGPMSENVSLSTTPEGMRTLYVLLERDETLSVTYQREQAKNAAVERLVALDAGHSAFVSQPRELAAILLSA